MKKHFLIYAFYVTFLITGCDHSTEPDGEPPTMPLLSVIYVNNSFLCKWTDSMDADFDAYRLYESFNIDMTGEVEIFMSNNLNDTTFVVTGIGAKERRYYRVTVTDKVGLETTSSVVSALSPNTDASYQITDSIDANALGKLLHLSSDGVDLLILGDQIVVVNSFGDSLNAFDLEDPFKNGITYDGKRIIIASGPTFEQIFLRNIDPVTGVSSGRLCSALGSVKSLAFDGSRLFVGYNVVNTGSGVLVPDIRIFDPSTCAFVEDPVSVAINTSEDITSSWVSGMVWHKEELFIAIGGRGPISRFSSDLNLIEEIPLPSGAYLRGIAMIGDDMFVLDSDNDRIWRYSQVSIQ